MFCLNLNFLGPMQLGFLTTKPLQIFKEWVDNALEKFVLNTGSGAKLIQRSPFPKLSYGSISLSHKRCEDIWAIGMLFSAINMPLGIDLELLKHKARANRLSKRYRFPTDLDPLEAFASLEASVKCVTMAQGNKPYFSDFVFEKNGVLIYTPASLKIKALALSFDDFKAVIARVIT